VPVPCTILYSHDYGEDLGKIYTDLQILKETLHVNVIAYEFPGCGLNNSEFTELNCLDAINVTYNYLIQGKQLPPEKIIIMGKTTGASISISYTSNLFALQNITQKKKNI